MTSVGLKFNWGDVSQGFVRANRVVLFQPTLSLFADLVEIYEAPGIENAITIDPVEPLDEGILRWLAWLGVFNHGVSLLAPGDEGRTRELRPVVDANSFRSTPDEQDPTPLSKPSSWRNSSYAWPDVKEGEEIHAIYLAKENVNLAAP